MSATNLAAVDVPISLHDQVQQDCDELRDIAKWFEKRSLSDTNGKWLRSVAQRYEVISGAYNTACRRADEYAELIEAVKRLRNVYMEPIGPLPAYEQDSVRAARSAVFAALARCGGTP